MNIQEDSTEQALYKKQARKPPATDIFPFENRQGKDQGAKQEGIKYDKENIQCTI
jgi:hypothetical protein